MKAYVSFLFFLVSTAILAVGPAHSSETLSHHGTFRTWKVFKLENTALTVCYAATKSSHFHPKIQNRDRPILYIVRYPKTSATNTLEIRFGTDVSRYNSVTAKLVARRRPKKDTFALTTKKDAGFLPSESDQDLLVTAMKKGRQLLVVSQPGTGDILEDRYSLFGYTKALNKLEQLCPGPQPIAPQAPAVPTSSSEAPGEVNVPSPVTTPTRSGQQ